MMQFGHAFMYRNDRKSDCPRVTFPPSSSPILNREGCRGTTDDFTTSFFHFFVLHCPLGLSELQACPFLDAVFPPFPLSASSSSPFHCALQDGLAGCDEQESCPYHFSLHLFTMVSRCSCGPIACWILAQTSCLVIWSLYEMHSSQGWHFPLKVNCSGGLWVYKIRLTNHQKATGVSWTERSTLFHKLIRGKSSEGGKRPEAHQIMIKVKLHEGFNHISPF